MMKNNTDAWNESYIDLYNPVIAKIKNKNRLKLGKFFELVKQNDLILEFFCGKCEMADELSKYYKNIYCADYCFDFLKYSNSKKTEKICMNCENVALRKQKFNSIYIQGGLHHLSSLEKIILCLENCKFLLKPNGYLFISEPSPTIFLRLWIKIVIETPLHKLTQFTNNWKNIYQDEKVCHQNFLNSNKDIHKYFEKNWKIILKKKRIFTQIITLQKGS